MFWLIRHTSLSTAVVLELGLVEVDADQPLLEVEVELGRLARIVAL